MKLKISLFLLIVSGLFILHDQAQSFLKFEKLSIKEGLSQSSAQCIMQDSRGFMWIGTQDGLNRYDGYSFEVYKHEPGNPNSLLSNNVLKIFEDKNRIFWLSTARGLHFFDPGSNKFFTHYHGKDLRQGLKVTVICFYQDTKGILWIGSANNGLTRFNQDTGTWKQYLNDPENSSSLSNNQISSICEDDTGKLWVGTAGGLNSFDPETQKFTSYKNQARNLHSLSINMVTTVAKGPKGYIWVGTWGGGVDRFNPKTGRFEHFRSQIPNDLNQIQWVSRIFFEKSGKVWVGCRGGGLYSILSFEQGHFAYYFNKARNPYSIGGNVILSLKEDRTGNLWIGTMLNGISLIKKQKQQFRHFYQTEQSKLSNSVTCFGHDKDNRFWYGTKGILFRYAVAPDGTYSIKNFSWDPEISDTVSGSSFSAILNDSSGDLWIATGYYGLNLYHPETDTFTRFLHDPKNPGSISNDNISSLLEGRNNDLWVGTLAGGLNRYIKDKKKFERILSQPENPAGLSSNSIKCLAWDLINPEVLWIGHSFTGLDRFNSDSREVRNFRNKKGKGQGPNTNNVVCIHISPQNPEVIWMGTGGGGLNRFDQKTGDWSYFTEKNGLCNNTVLGILEGKDHKLWMSTNNGISRFDPETRVFENYFLEDGLQSNEFCGGSYYKSKKGTLYFGGINGFNYFKTPQIKKNRVIPQILITGFKKFNKSVILEQEIFETSRINLTYRDNVFSFEFTALDFSNSNKNQYAYKLEGFNKSWIPTDASNRVAAFTNIPHGTYTFRVKGSNNDGEWNEEGASIKIIISPPFYKTIWFRMLLILVAFFIIIYLYKKRIVNLENKLRRENRVNLLCSKYTISKREKEVLELLLLGNNNKDIEDKLFISIGTVKNHIYNIYQKVEVKNRNELFLKFKSLE